MNGELILENVIKSLPSIWPLIYYTGLLIGLSLSGIGLYSFVSGGRQNQNTKGAILMLVAGILLVNLTGFLNMMAQSVLSQASQTGLSYGSSATDPASLYIKFAIYVTMLVGLAGFVRGLVLISRSESDSRNIGPAITHIIGGTLGVNIEGTLKMLANTMGSTVTDILNHILWLK